MACTGSGSRVFGDVIPDFLAALNCIVAADSGLVEEEDPFIKAAAVVEDHRRKKYCEKKTLKASPSDSIGGIVEAGKLDGQRSSEFYCSAGKSAGIHRR